jgi:hypothetical protein
MKDHHKGKNILGSSASLNANFPGLSDFKMPNLWESGGMVDSVVTSEQEAALIGRVVVAKRAAEKRLAVLLEESRRIGDVLGSIAGYMRGNVQYVWFDDVSTNENYPHPRGDSFRVADVDGERIAKLTSEIRDAKDEIKRLSQQARDLGL